MVVNSNYVRKPKFLTLAICLVTIFVVSATIVISFELAQEFVQVSKIVPVGK